MQIPQREVAMFHWQLNLRPIKSYYMLYYMLDGHEIYEAQSDRRAVRGKKHRLQKAGNLTETTITRQRENEAFCPQEK